MSFILHLVHEKGLFAFTFLMRINDLVRDQIGFRKVCNNELWLKKYRYVSFIIQSVKTKILKIEECVGSEESLSHISQPNSFISNTLIGSTGIFRS